MKGISHYKIGQAIGQFTIVEYEPESGKYTLLCSCGNTSSGKSEYVSTKIANMIIDGFSACQKCSNLMRTRLGMLKTQNEEILSLKEVYRDYVKRAKNKGISFSLSFEDAKSIFLSDCSYCGRAPSNKRTRSTGYVLYYQGIDRIDNTLGYTAKNTVPCCKYCNAFKLDRSVEDMMDHINDIVQHIREIKEKGSTTSSIGNVESSDSKWEAPHSSIDEG